MQNFSFFEIGEKQANDVIQALNKASVNGRKVVVEVAGENSGKSDNGGRKRSGSSDKAGTSSSKGRGERSAAKAKSDKPSRSERGYSDARGPKKENDWKQFFDGSHNDLKGDEPNFEEEGWARRKKKK